MNRSVTFGRTLALWFMAGLCTEAAVANMIRSSRQAEAEIRHEASCSASGGHLVRSGAKLRCLTCEGR